MNHKEEIDENKLPRNIADIEKVIVASFINEENPIRHDLVSCAKTEFNIFTDSSAQQVFETFVETLSTKEDGVPPNIMEMMEYVRTEHGEVALEEFGSHLHSVRGFFSQRPTTKIVETFLSEKMVRKLANKLYDDNEDTESVIAELQTASSFTLEKSKVVSAFSDWQNLHDYMHREDSGIETHLTELNKAVRGKLNRGELHCFLAPPNMGKSLVMGSIASQMALNGADVLYVSMELASEKVQERVIRDSAQVSGEQLFKMNKEQMGESFGVFRQRNVENNFDIIQFPTGTANANHIRQVMREKYLKSGKHYDAVVVDYLGITAPFRKIPLGGGTNEHIRVVSQELRALAIETESVVITAMQVNRGGVDKDRLTMTDIADGISIMHIADSVIAMTLPMDRNPDKDCEDGYYLFDFLKNRSGKNGRWFYVYVNFDRMSIYDEEIGTEGNIKRTIRKGVEETGEDKEKTNIFKKMNMNKNLDAKKTKKEIKKENEVVEQEMSPSNSMYDWS